MFLNRINHINFFKKNPIKSGHKTLQNTVCKFLTKNGYKVFQEFPLSKYHFADILGSKDDKLIIFEIKPHGFKIDQSDFMELFGLSIVLQRKKQFKDKKIKKCMIASGSISNSASDYAEKLGINVIINESKNNIEKEIEKCILI